MGLFNIPATTASSHYNARTKQEVAPATLPVSKSDSIAESSGKTVKKIKCQICRMDRHEVSDFQLCLSSGYPGTDPLRPPPVWSSILSDYSVRIGDLMTSIDALQHQG
ncbi:hypothetical protein TKK_0015670 [Trichogramma kaykai]